MVVPIVLAVVALVYLVGAWRFVLWRDALVTSYMEVHGTLVLDDYRKHIHSRSLWYSLVWPLAAEATWAVWGDW